MKRRPHLGLVLGKEEERILLPSIDQQGPALPSAEQLGPALPSVEEYHRIS